MKKILLLAISVIMVFALAGCGAELTEAEQPYVGSRELIDVRYLGISAMDSLGDASGTLELKDNKKGSLTIAFNGEEETADLDWSENEEGQVAYTDAEGVTGNLVLEGSDVVLEYDGMEFVFGSAE